MSDVRRFLDVMRSATKASAQSQAFSKRISLGGSIGLLSNVFIKHSKAEEEIFLTADEQNDETIVPKLIYGRAWILAQVVNRGIARDTLDPSQIIDQFEVFEGLGENAGLDDTLPDGSASEDNGMENLIVNGLPYALIGLGVFKFLNSRFKQNKPSDSDSIWDTVTDLFNSDDADETKGTAEPVPKSTLKFEDLLNVEDEAPSTNDIKIFGNTCQWENKDFAQALIDAGIDVTGLDIKDDGTLVVSDIDTINFQTALSVVDNADGSVTINATGGSAVDVKDEGSVVVGGATSINFIGSCIVATDAGGGQADVTIDCSGTGGGGGTAEDNCNVCDGVVVNFSELEASYKDLSGTTVSQTLAYQIQPDPTTGTWKTVNTSTVPENGGRTDDYVQSTWNTGLDSYDDSMVVGGNYYGDSPVFNNDKIEQDRDDAFGGGEAIKTTRFFETTSLESQCAVKCTGMPMRLLGEGASVVSSPATRDLGTDCSLCGTEAAQLKKANVRLASTADIPGTFVANQTNVVGSGAVVEARGISAASNKLEVLYGGTGYESPADIIYRTASPRPGGLSDSHTEVYTLLSGDALSQASVVDATAHASSNLFDDQWVEVRSTSKLDELTVSNANATYFPNSAAPMVIDGVTVSAGDRILLKDQTDVKENGIWVVKDAGVEGTTDAVLRRSGDMFQDWQVQSSTWTTVDAGTNIGKKFEVSRGDPLFIRTMPDTETGTMTFIGQEVGDSITEFKIYDEAGSVVHTATVSAQYTGDLDDFVDDVVDEINTSSPPNNITVVKVDTENVPSFYLSTDEYIPGYRIDMTVQSASPVRILMKGRNYFENENYRNTLRVSAIPELTGLTFAEIAA